MQEKLGIIPMPEWLFSQEYVFNIKDILKDSLYYPCVGSDEKPVWYFRKNVHSFIYVSNTRTDGEENIDWFVGINQPLEYNGFLGFRIIRRKSIKTLQLTDNELKLLGGGLPLTGMQLNEQYHNPNRYAYPDYEWFIFENSSGERFSLIQLYNDPVTAYDALYLTNKVKPKILFVDCARNGFKENWTNISSNEYIEPFVEYILSDENLSPEYLVTDFNPMSEYSVKVDSLTSGMECNTCGSSEIIKQGDKYVCQNFTCKDIYSPFSIWSRK